MSDIEITDITSKYLLTTLNDDINTFTTTPITEKLPVSILILNINNIISCSNNIIYFLNKSKDILIIDNSDESKKVNRFNLTNKLTALLIKVEFIMSTPVSRPDVVKIYEFTKRLRSIIYSLIYNHKELWKDNKTICNENNILICHGIYEDYLKLEPAEVDVNNKITNNVQPIKNDLDDYSQLIRHLNNIYDIHFNNEENNNKINFINNKETVRLAFSIESNNILGINLIYLLNFIKIDNIPIEYYIKNVLQLFVIGTEKLIIFKYWYKFDYFRHRTHQHMLHSKYIDIILNYYKGINNIIIYNDIIKYIANNHDDYNWKNFVRSLKPVPDYKNKLYLKNYIKNKQLPLYRGSSYFDNKEDNIRDFGQEGIDKIIWYVKLKNKLYFDDYNVSLINLQNKSLTFTEDFINAFPIYIEYIKAPGIGDSYAYYYRTN